MIQISGGHCITRIASGTCIDNYLTNLEGTFAVSNISIADHQAITAKILVNRIDKQKEVTYRYRVMKEDNWLKFKNDIFNLNISGNSINEKWDNLSADLKKIIDNDFPLKNTKKKYRSLQCAINALSYWKIDVGVIIKLLIIE